ncbi:MAG: 50S ribosomal protein L13 [Parcubacteria group bacterium]
MNTHTIDATGKALGRLASRIAIVLRGKIRPDYQPYKMPREQVIVENIAKVKFSGNKLEQKKYYHYSGYPGGMRERKLKDKFRDDPAWVLRTAVYKMLAPNKIRDEIIKNLIIK